MSAVCRNRMLLCCLGSLRPHRSAAKQLNRTLYIYKWGMIMDADDKTTLLELLRKFDGIQLVPASDDGDVITAVVYSSKEIFKEIKYHADLIPDDRIRAKVEKIDVSYDDIYGLYEAYSDLKPAMNDLRKIISNTVQGRQEFKYYSKRKNQNQNDVKTLLLQLGSLFQYYKERDYFLENLSIEGKHDIPDEAINKCIIDIGFNGYDTASWGVDNTTKDRIFDVIEYFFKYASKPGPWVPMSDETGWNYYGYEYYSANQGQYEFRQDANKILVAFAEGFELGKNGQIVYLGDEATKLIFDAEIPGYDLENMTPLQKGVGGKTQI